MSFQCEPTNDTVSLVFRGVYEDIPRSENQVRVVMKAASASQR